MASDFMSRPPAGRTLATVLAAAGLSFICPHALDWGGGASAAEIGGPPSPPADTPIMAAGLRVPRAYGALEISTFSISQKEKETEFAVEVVVRNETSPSSVSFSAAKSLRLITDGVPLAPATTGDGCCGLDVPVEAAKYDGATFVARGHPRTVYLQIGTGDEGRAFLRWPQ